MREFEDRFVTLGLPYRVIGGPRFYERAEIRDALAYLRVINSPADDLAFERIVNVPKRGLGDATVQMLHDHARKRRIPLFEAARAVVETDELKPKARGALRDLILHFDRWRAQREVTRAYRTGRNRARRERLHRNVAEGPFGRRRRTAGQPERTGSLDGGVREPARFPRAHLAGDGPRRRRDDEAVSLMTLHSAKGLEFDNVFLPGWEEGLFPSQRTLDEQGRAGLEEERRLAHVGLTRARRRAKLYFATNRRIHGTWSTTIPSRFLDELPAHNVEITGSRAAPAGAAAAATARRGSTMWNPFGSELRDAGLAARAGQPRPQSRSGPGRRRASTKNNRRSQAHAAKLRRTAVSRATSAARW